MLFQGPGRTHYGYRLLQKEISDGEGTTKAFFLLHLLIVIGSFSCISVKLPEPAYVNPELPAAQEGPPYPILN